MLRFLHLLALLSCLAACATHDGEKPQPCVGVEVWARTNGPTGIDNAASLHVHGNVLILVSFRGVIRSEDGGATWEDARGFHSGLPSVVAGVGTTFFAPVGSHLLFRSDDGGRSWREVALPAEGHVFGLAADGERIYLSLLGVTGPRGFAIGEGGLAWEELATPPVEGERPFRIYPAGAYLLATTSFPHRIYLSRDRGRSWEALPESVGPVARAEAFGAHGGRLFAVSQQDAVIYSSLDEGATWETTPIDAGNLSFGDSYLAETEQGFFAGLGSGLVLRWEAAEGRWIRAEEGLPAGFLVSLAGGAPGLFAIVGNSLLRYVSTSSRWETVGSGLVRTSVPVLTVDEGRLLALDGRSNLHLTRDGGRSWQRLEVPDGRQVQAVAAAEGSIWAAVEGRGILRWNGSHWEEAGGGFPTYVGAQGRQPREVAALVVREGALLAAIGGGYERTDDPHEPLRRTGAGVWRSDDGGASWYLSAAGLPVSADAFVPLVSLHAAGESLFAATEEADLYRSDDGGTTWRRVGEGLPRWVFEAIPVEGLEGWLFAHVGEVSGLFRSSDRGERFVPLPPPGPEYRWVSAMAAGPRGLVAVWRGEEAEPAPFLTRDGESWEPMDGAGAPGAHPLSLRWGGGGLFVGTDGQGVWRLGGRCENPHW